MSSEIDSLSKSTESFRNFAFLARVSISIADRMFSRALMTRRNAATAETGGLEVYLSNARRPGGLLNWSLL